MLKDLGGGENTHALMEHTFEYFRFVFVALFSALFLYQMTSCEIYFDDSSHTPSTQREEVKNPGS